MELEKLKYPIGKFQLPETITQEIINRWINEIESFPGRLRKEVGSLSEEQLDIPYRLGGWTIRQVVHHLADSDMNFFIRIKLALTEETPVIKPYFEERWAELTDSKNFPIEPSLQLLEALHFRWTELLKTLSKEELKKTFIHPEHQKESPLDEIIGFCVWHENHHLAHITILKNIKNG